MAIVAYQGGQAVSNIPRYIGYAREFLNRYGPDVYNAAGELYSNYANYRAANQTVSSMFSAPHRGTVAYKAAAGGGGGGYGGRFGGGSFRSFRRRRVGFKKRRFPYRKRYVRGRGRYAGRTRAVYGRRPVGVKKTIQIVNRYLRAVNGTRV